MEVLEINSQEFNEQINTDGIVVIDCYAVWCGPCKLLGPIIDDLAHEQEDVTFYKLNVDNNDVIAKQYGIMAIPTLLFFNKGELKETSVGFKSKDDIIEIINNLKK